MNREPPYICVSALQTPGQLHAINAHLQKKPVVQDSHDIVLGVAIDHKTVQGSDPGRRKLRSLEELITMAAHIQETARLSVHIDCVDEHYDPTLITNLDELLRLNTRRFCADALQAAGVIDPAKLHSFQLNGVPRAEDVAAFKEGIGDTPIIYPLRRDLVELGDEAVLAHLNACRQHITHILIDLSGGEGIRSSNEELGRLIRLVHHAAPDATVGIAGGLGPANIAEIYAPLAAEHGILSIDAETQLRDPGTDDVDLPRVLAYLDNASEAVTR